MADNNNGDANSTRGHLGLGFERSLNPMLIVDTEERRYLDANAAACLFMRIPREEVVNHRVDEFIPPEFQTDIDERWRKFLRDGGASEDVEWYFPDGERRVPIVVGAAPIRPRQHLIVVLPWTTHEEADAALIAEVDKVEKAGHTFKLTDREREVLTLLALGDTGEQIAQQLFISPETVRTHVQHARQKLGATTRGHAIALALGAGEIAPDLTAVRPVRADGPDRRVSQR
jgi:DNA-binding CsgD family transcriptional regulator